MNNPFQPPSTPLEPPRFSLGSTHAFSVDIEAADIAAAGGGTRSSLMPIAIPFGVAALMIFSGLTRLASGEFDIRLGLPFLLAAVMIALGSKTLWNQRTIVRRTIAARPSVVGPHSGEIDEQTIRIESPQGWTSYRVPALTYARMSGGVLVFSCDRHLSTLHYLPARAFGLGEFENVAAYLVQQAKNVPRLPASIFDPRLLSRADISLVTLPPSAIPFAGPLTLRDLRQSGLKDRLAKLARNTIAWLLVFNVIIGSVAVYLYVCAVTPLAVVLCILLVWINWRLVVQLRRVLGVGQADAQVLVEYAGYVDASALRVATAISESLYKWSAFERVQFADGVISLRLPGTLGHSVLLTRPMFSQADWLRAIEIIQRVVPTTG